MSGNVQERFAYDEFEDVLIDGAYTLWLINDDYNTFDFVIDTLVELCCHTHEQAVQCAFIAHNSGKCDIYRSHYEEVESIANTMLNRGLTVKITE
ncbi:MAG: ATP-dependent Clp protease adaptor ClpS [Lentimicrobiaceae bacterium]|nr:ATP-dependent Clp protease adaptor ClpS [Lentimicrobiaceae bacterium]